MAAAPALTTTTPSEGMAAERAKQPAWTIVNTISLMIVMAYIGMMPLWMFFPPASPPEVLAILNQMMGAWGMAFAAVIGFHIGSSKESQNKGDALNTLATATVRKSGPPDNNGGSTSKPTTVSGPVTVAGDMNVTEAARPPAVPAPVVEPPKPLP